MKKNKLIAYILIGLAIMIPLNFGFLSMDETQGVVSLTMMVLFEFLVLGALILGVDKK